MRTAIDAMLAARLDAALGRASVLGRPVAAVVEAARSMALRGGKRFRGALCGAAYEAWGGEGGHLSVVPAGVALELLQLYLLIHDDWMDGDELRRGGPTVHAALRREFSSESLGAMGAVLAGDHCAALAQSCLFDLAIAPEQVVRASKEFARMQDDVALGQMVDVLAHASSAAAMERMHELKTGSYTVAGPLRLGAALAGADDLALDALSAFARPLGVAFQLRDDLLGSFGDPGVTGKPRGTDVLQGKRSAVVLEGLASPGADMHLAPVWSGTRESGSIQAGHSIPSGPSEGETNSPPSDPRLTDALDFLERCGARRRVEERLAVLLEEARAASRTIPVAPRGQRLLAGAVDALGLRSL
jgi:geranylgeranyl diphosphate synthase type I